MDAASDKIIDSWSWTIRWVLLPAVASLFLTFFVMYVLAEVRIKELLESRATIFNELLQKEKEIVDRQQVLMQQHTENTQRIFERLGMGDAETQKQIATINAQERIDMEKLNGEIMSIQRQIDKNEMINEELHQQHQKR